MYAPVAAGDGLSGPIQCFGNNTRDIWGPDLCNFEPQSDDSLRVTSPSPNFPFSHQKQEGRLAPYRFSISVEIRRGRIFSGWFRSRVSTPKAEPACSEALQDLLVRIEDQFWQLLLSHSCLCLWHDNPSLSAETTVLAK
ncbi:hypothetical protein AVEN_97965-1 [Araneus ventricosus]|uniref:Uncharacterized protein n=1 Tax=Araneus ventricosus TaxID=182803 RepID=A0A4Y2MMW4_ARAVE|nr:hypothetical protein AVEN_97965-1 [Araneus ventricosus]